MAPALEGIEQCLHEEAVFQRVVPGEAALGALQHAAGSIREAMRGKGMVALGRVVLAKRERVIMIEPWDKELMGTTLRYPYEIRDARE